MSIPEIASELVKNNFEESKNFSSSSTIIVVGSKQVGKSTLINSFLEKNEKSRDTLVLEYSFARKSSQSPGIDKLICHVWEYGGKLELFQDVIVSIPVKGKLYLCIMVDLSKGKSLWKTISLCLDALSCYADHVVPELIIIGGKYDLFKNLESEVKKLVSTTLRSVAILYNAHIIFYSQKEAPLVKKVKDMFYGMAFGKGVNLKEKSTNVSKPLIIAKGLDTWENIGVTASTLEQIKIRYAAKISSEAEAVINNSSGIQRTHPEPILDTLAAIKYEELKNMQYYDASITNYLYCLN